MSIKYLAILVNRANYSKTNKFNIKNSRINLLVRLKINLIKKYLAFKNKMIVSNSC